MTVLGNPPLYQATVWKGKIQKHVRLRWRPDWLHCSLVLPTLPEEPKQRFPVHWGEQRRWNATAAPEAGYFLPCWCSHASSPRTGSDTVNSTVKVDILWWKCSVGSILKGTLYLEVFYALAIIIIHPTRSTTVYVLDISGTETPTGTAKCAGLRLHSRSPVENGCKAAGRGEVLSYQTCSLIKILPCMFLPFFFLNTEKREFWDLSERKGS